MHGVGLGSLQSFHAHRSREALRVPVETERQGPKAACSQSECAPDTKRQAVYQSVVLVLRERFSVSSQGSAPAAGLTGAEQADNQLAATIGAALNSSTGEPADQVGASVEEGLQQVLGDSGEGTEAGGLADLAAEIRNRVQSLVAAFVAARADGAAQSTSAKITTRERGVLEIRTLEGDVVKIDFRNSTSVRLNSTSGAEGTQETLKVRISEKTSLQVEGDLNPAELAAIGDLVRKVDTLADEFFAGDVEQAFAAAQNLQMDTSQLADYSLKLGMSQKVRIHSMGVPVMITEPVPAREPAPESAPVSTGSALAGTAAVPANTEVAANEAAPEAAVPADPASGSSTPVSSGSGDLPVANVQQIIGTFVAKLRASFTVSATEAGLGITSSVKLKLLAAVIESHTRSSAATPDATAALTQVAEKAEIAG